MQIGSLRHRVIIQSQQTTKNEYGEEIIDWLESVPIWAKVMHQKGSESFLSAQQNATRTIKVLMRFREGVENTQRIKFRGDVYDIHDVDETLKHRGELWIMGRAHNV